jgi:glycine/D-amino acid oxidase-like deaminating enzyme/nitrite reductase/ring-hydroxylating ferredoxin subunit
MPEARRTSAGPSREQTSARVSSSTEPLWLRDTRIPSFPMLQGAVESEVVVVGAGITGLTTALFLQRQGQHVIVLEAESLGGGTSGATSAHVTYVTDLRYARMIDRLGTDGARIFVREALRAFETMQELAAGGCDWQSVPGVLYTENEEDVASLQKEETAAAKLGVPAAFGSDAGLPFPVRAALVFPDQARFDPVAYLKLLAQQFAAAGGRVFSESRVRSWDETDSRVRFHTDHGLASAPRAVLATHSPAGFNLVQIELGPYRSYVLAVTGGDSVPDALFWDMEDPYHYWRRARFQGRDVVLVGGEDEKVGQEEDPAQNYRRLEDYARGHIDVKDVVARWSAQYYEPADGLPYVGRSPLSKKVFIATGYSGVGLVQGTLAARILSDRILGRPAEIDELLEATRLRPAAAAKNVVAENVDVAVQLVKDWLPGADTSLEGLGKNQGRVIKKDGRPLAVFRDANGALHARSAVCTHLGCVVHWNGTERSWDCPCHGGRYSPDGEILDGPPLSPLRPEPLE